MREKGLRNDRDAVISVVAEHYTTDDKYLRRAKILSLKDCPDKLKKIEHSTNWIFAYDSRSNIVYIGDLS